MIDEDSRRIAQHRDAQHRDAQHSDDCGWLPATCDYCGETFDQLEALFYHSESGCSGS
jgi:hypothetical protein